MGPDPDMKGRLVTLYRGTRAAFGHGGYMVPVGDGLHTGPADDPGHGLPGMIRVTEDYEEAAAWALACRGRGRPRVVEVTPLGPVEDVEGVLVCEWARVDKVAGFIDLQAAS